MAAFAVECSTTVEVEEGAGPGSARWRAGVVRGLRRSSRGGERVGAADARFGRGKVPVVSRMFRRGRVAEISGQRRVSRGRGVFLAPMRPSCDRRVSVLSRECFSRPNGRNLGTAAAISARKEFSGGNGPGVVSEIVLAAALAKIWRGWRLHCAMQGFRGRSGALLTDPARSNRCGCVLLHPRAALTSLAIPGVTATARRGCATSAHGERGPFSGCAGVAFHVCRCQLARIAFSRVCASVSASRGSGSQWAGFQKATPSASARSPRGAITAVNPER